MVSSPINMDQLPKQGAAHSNASGGSRQSGATDQNPGISCLLLDSGSNFALNTGGGQEKSPESGRRSQVTQNPVNAEPSTPGGLSRGKT
jgi:hypothetical protein